MTRRPHVKKTKGGDTINEFPEIGYFTTGRGPHCGRSGGRTIVRARHLSAPGKNITLVLPFAAGSGTDTTTRIISKDLAKALGTSIVIENKPGANGSIAASYVARAEPDGYTIFVTTNTSHSANPYLLKNMTYDPIKDFTPIARTGDLPFMLVIDPKLPVNSVADLIALAKKEPGKYLLCQRQFVGHRLRRDLCTLAGIDLLHVPYKAHRPRSPT